VAFRCVGKFEDFPLGQAREVVFGPRRIAIYRLEGSIHAVKNVCPHQGDALHRAPPENGAAVCQSHGWRFDLRSGACLRGEKDARIAVYPVKLVGDEVWIDVD
jgi:nitrite reductase/ring-hydroxylating ferredoxin subunit